MAALAIIAIFEASSPRLALAATGFDLTLVRPSASGAAYVHQESAALLPAGSWAWAIVANGSQDPLILREPATNQHQGGLIAWRAEATASAAWAPLDRLTLAISLAGIPWQSGSGDAVPLATAAASPRHQAMGEASVLVKLGLWGAADHPGFRLTLSGELFAPTGQSASYAGSGGWTALGRVWAGYLGRRTSVTLGIGYDLVPRADVPLAGVLIDDRWTASAAVSFRVASAVTLLAEAQASVLVETARRGYQRGFVAALQQAPAYALAGARIDVLPRAHLLLAAWKGLDASPGAARLGFLAGWNATWDGPLARARATFQSPAAGEVGQGRTAPEDKLEKRVHDRGDDDEADTDSSDAPAEAPTEAAGGPADEKAKADKDTARGKNRSMSPPACPNGDCIGANVSAPLVRLEDGQLVLARPLPFKGRSAKLAAASIPALKAIAKIMKEQPAGARLALRLESVGARPLDLALAKKRAQALRGVFAHLAGWPVKRISALGVPSTRTGADVAQPPISLELSIHGAHAITDSVNPVAAAEPEAIEQKEPEQKVTIPSPPCPAGTGDCQAGAEAASGELASHQGDEIVLRDPLPFQGKSAKLAAASIPTLRAIARIMKEQPAGTRLTLSLEAVGPRRADLTLAKRRAQALRGVFAHLARWPVKRIAAVGVAPTAAPGDPSLPPLKLRLR